MSYNRDPNAEEERPMAKAPQPEGAAGTPLDQTALKQYAGYFLARARFVAFRKFEQHVGTPHGLRPVEFSVMVLLDSNRDVTQKQLSQALGVAQPNMTGVLRRLEERGLVERTRAEQDKRMQFITLTAAGSQLLRQAVAASQGMDERWMHRLTAAERAMLVELLEKLTLSGPPSA
jgi:DNA-binding MarR family transcriptional regulator